MNALRSALLAVEQSARCDGDPRRALHDTMQAIESIAQREAADGALNARRRRQLVPRGGRIVSAIIRRGVAAGAFRPGCPEWAVESLPQALVAGVCARWVVGLPAERSLGAGAAVAAALAVLRPPVPAGRRSSPLDASVRGRAIAGPT
jgi:hypothetical protein